MKCSDQNYPVLLHSHPHPETFEIVKHLFSFKKRGEILISLKMTNYLEKNLKLTTDYFHLSRQINASTSKSNTTQIDFVFSDRLGRI